MPGRVPPELPADAGMIARRLDHLFRTVVSPTSAPYTYEYVAQAVQDRFGVSMTPSFIWRVRMGRRRTPGYERLAALAKFFSVPPAYFFDDDVAAKVDEQLELLAVMQDATLQEWAARTSSQLSAEEERDVIQNLARRILEDRRRAAGEEDDGGAGPDDRT